MHFVPRPKVSEGRVLPAGNHDLAVFRNGESLAEQGSLRFENLLVLVGFLDGASPGFMRGAAG
jgi:hypothetical protein